MVTPELPALLLSSAARCGGCGLPIRLLLLLCRSSGSSTSSTRSATVNCAPPRRRSDAAAGEAREGVPGGGRREEDNPEEDLHLKKAFDAVAVAMPPKEITALGFSIGDGNARASLPAELLRGQASPPWQSTRLATRVGPVALWWQESLQMHDFVEGVAPSGRDSGECGRRRR